MEKTPKIFNEFKKSHLSQWMGDSGKPTKRFQRILKALGKLIAKLFSKFTKWMTGLKKLLNQHPRLKIIGIVILALLIVGVSIYIGVAIGEKKNKLSIPNEYELIEGSRTVGEIERDLSEQFQEIVNEKFKDTGYRYAIYLRLIQTEFEENVGSLLEVYPVTANSWDNLFRRDREEVIEKFVKLYKKYINKKFGQIHIRNNVRVLAEAIWEVGKKLNVDIKK